MEGVAYTWLHNLEIQIGANIRRYTKSIVYETPVPIEEELLATITDCFKYNSLIPGMLDNIHNTVIIFTHSPKVLRKVVAVLNRLYYNFNNSYTSPDSFLII